MLEIKAITHRRRSALPERFCRSADNLLLSALIRDSLFIEDTVKIACPAVRAVNVPRAGRSVSSAMWRSKKTQEGEAKLAAMAAFVADPFLKFVVVVDHDVNHDDTDVLHAIATRVRPTRTRYGALRQRLAARPGLLRSGRRLEPDHQGRDRRHAQGQLSGRIGVPGSEAIDMATSSRLSGSCSRYCIRPRSVSTICGTGTGAASAGSKLSPLA